MINGTNLLLFNFINGLSNQSFFIDLLMIIIAKFFILIPLIYLVIKWIKGDDELVIKVVINVVSALIINQLISSFYFHPRPFVNSSVVPLINHSNDSSFPSDHTTFALTIGLSLLLLKDRFGFPLLINGLLIGFSRIFVGVHYPFDIIGSIIVSLIFSFSYIIIPKPLFNKLVNISNSFKSYIHNFFFKGR